MCEYCGCQALASIAQLTAEHDQVVAVISLVNAALAAGDRPAVAAHVREISRLLGPHTAVEEQGLFPALVAEFPDHVDHLVAEHRAIEAVLAEVGALTTDDPGIRDPAEGSDTGAPAGLAGWAGRLTAALHQLRRHILTEQDGVFPAALGALGPADWDEVDAVRARVGTALPDHPQPTPADGHRSR